MTRFLCNSLNKRCLASLASSIFNSIKRFPLEVNPTLFTDENLSDEELSPDEKSPTLKPLTLYLLLVGSLVFVFGIVVLASYVDTPPETLSSFAT